MTPAQACGRGAQAVQDGAGWEHGCSKSVRFGGMDVAGRGQGSNAKGKKAEIQKRISASSGPGRGCYAVQETPRLHTMLDATSGRLWPHTWEYGNCSSSRTPLCLL